MAFDTYVIIEGIVGESTDEKHAGWIEVISFETKVRQKISSTAGSAGGASTERADFESFSFSKLIDKATPKLALACADGTHIDNIEWVCTQQKRSGGCAAGQVATGWSLEKN
jgi:type VI secretion system secreted protein Hcp